MRQQWSDELQVAQVRVARPTDKIKEIEKFYCEGVGLKKSALFQDIEATLVS